MFNFDAKVFLVTGSNSGMGRTTAVELAKCGAHVVCAARRRDRGEEVLAQVRSFHGRGHFFPTDIADADNVAGLFDFVRREFGRLDGAFNNAAIEAPRMPLADTPIELFDEVQRVNLRGTFLCLRQELAIMRTQKSGSVVNTSSTAGITGMPNAAAYVSSKHGVVGLTRTAALDMAALGVRVNCICPGSVDTEMMQRWTNNDPVKQQALADFSPMKRVGTPGDIAGAVLWFFSDYSRYATGQILSVDGGVSVGIMA
jgi:NAD(P)-dependent dehydrogenase (short-subunit alcohol dehydrogenase family)